MRGLGDGTLPIPAFRRYLTQDHLFLIQFARAYARLLRFGHGWLLVDRCDVRTRKDG